MNYVHSACLRAYAAFSLNLPLLHSHTVESLNGAGKGGAKISPSIK